MSDHVLSRLHFPPPFPAPHGIDLPIALRQVDPGKHRTMYKAQIGKDMQRKHIKISTKILVGIDLLRTETRYAVNTDDNANCAKAWIESVM